MSRRFAQIHTDIWEDEDFLTLNPDSRFVFISSFSQKTITYCGVMVYSVPRLTRSTGLPAKRVVRAVRELHDRRYVFHDPQTGELLIRSFIRNNAVLAQAQLKKAMERSYTDVLSVPIRRLIMDELGSGYQGPCRHPDGEGANTLNGTLPKGCEQPAHQGDDQPADQGASRARVKDYRVPSTLKPSTLDVTRNPNSERSLTGTPPQLVAQLQRMESNQERLKADADAWKEPTEEEHARAVEAIREARAKTRADGGQSDLVEEEPW